MSDEFNLGSEWTDVQASLNAADNPLDEAKLIKGFLTTVIQFENNGGDIGALDGWVTNLSEVSDYYNKTTINSKFRASVEADLASSGSDRWSLFDMVHDHLVEVTKVTESDAGGDLYFYWTFEHPGRTDQQFNVTTEGDEKWSQSHFIDSIYAKSDIDVGYVDEGSLNRVSDGVPVDSWKKWLKDYLNESGKRVEQEVEGPRTQAAEKLKRLVQTNVAYNDEYIAVERLGKQAMAMEGEDSDMVLVTNDLIRKACGHSDITFSALYAQLKDNNALAGSKKQVNYRAGRSATWWQIRTEWASPKSFEEVDEDDLTSTFEESDDSLRL